MKALAFFDYEKGGESFVDIFNEHGHQLEFTLDWNRLVRLAKSGEYDCILTQTTFFKLGAIHEVLKEVNVLKVVLMNLRRNSGIRETAFSGMLNHPFHIRGFEAFFAELTKCVSSFLAKKGGP